MNEATRLFVERHREEDVRRLALQGGGNGVDLRIALQQIQGWQTARTKLPTWAAVAGVWYPPHLSMEQCSSELTARYKAALVLEVAQTMAPGVDGGAGVVDLTGGFGVDFFFMASAWATAAVSRSRTYFIYVERSEELCRLAAHNFELLNLRGEVKNADSIEFLKSLEHASVLFLDPARRDGHGGKVVLLEDCTPDVVALCDELLAKTDCLMLKLSPMLDWHRAVEQLSRPGWGMTVHVVSVKNECKELLLVVRKGGSEMVSVVCANWTGNDWERLAYADDENRPVTVWPPAPDETVLKGCWLLEPNASVMKAGCFGVLCHRFGVSALGQNSHLFIADDRVEGFPGRQLRIEGVSGMNKRELKGLLRGVERANVCVRNFPMTAEALRRRLGVKDGGRDFLYGTTLGDGRHVVLRGTS